MDISIALSIASLVGVCIVGLYTTKTLLKLDWLHRNVTLLAAVMKEAAKSHNKSVELIAELQAKVAELEGKNKPDSVEAE